MTEQLGPSLLDRLDSRAKEGLGIIAVQSLARHVVAAVYELHSAEILHADIKPENILYVDDMYRSAKLIDFGSARDLAKPIRLKIQTRWYRAPEVILGFECTDKVDMWSVGCVLYEAFMGNPIFPGRAIGILNQMAGFLGDFPARLVAHSPKRSKFFNADGTLKTVDQYYRERRRVVPVDAVQTWTEGVPSLESTICAWTPRAQGMEASEAGGGEEIDYPRQYLVTFLYGLLALDPAARLSAQDALSDPFLTTDFTDQ
jgi:dual specificity protein kinase YAK1